MLCGRRLGQAPSTFRPRGLEDYSDEDMDDELVFVSSGGGLGHTRQTHQEGVRGHRTPEA